VSIKNDVQAFHLSILRGQDGSRIQTPQNAVCREPCNLVWRRRAECSMCGKPIYKISSTQEKLLPNGYDSTVVGRFEFPS
jgi:hypothetical protein